MIKIGREIFAVNEARRMKVTFVSRQVRAQISQLKDSDRIISSKFQATIKTECIVIQKLMF